jgi:hypothetical protein
MVVPTYQTVKLSRGKHSSPTRGACVMELASMLAGESFTDHPASVCPVIAALLRQYNDWIDDGRRQDLYTYAAKVLDSRDADACTARLDRLVAWKAEVQRRRWTGRLIPARLRCAGDVAEPEVVARDAVRALGRRTDAAHAEVLGLIDELLMLGGRHRSSSATYARSLAPV